MDNLQKEYTKLEKKYFQVCTENITLNSKLLRKMESRGQGKKLKEIDSSVLKKQEEERQAVCDRYAKRRREEEDYQDFLECRSKRRS